MNARTVPIARFTACLDARTRWADHAYTGPGGTFTLAAGPKGWTVYRILTGASATRPTGPPVASLFDADRTALEYAADHNPRRPTL